MPKTLWSEAQEALVVALTQARKDAGLSQAALAKTLRCQQSLIARIESGERRIDLVELVIVSRAIGMEIPCRRQNYLNLSTFFSSLRT